MRFVLASSFHLRSIFLDELRVGSFQWAKSDFWSHFFALPKKCSVCSEWFCFLRFHFGYFFSLILDFFLVFWDNCFFFSSILWFCRKTLAFKSNSVYFILFFVCFVFFFVFTLCMLLRFDLIERAENEIKYSKFDHKRKQNEHERSEQRENKPAWTIFWSFFYLFASFQFPQPIISKWKWHNEIRIFKRAMLRNHRQINCVAWFLEVSLFCLYDYVPLGNV